MTYLKEEIQGKIWPCLLELLFRGSKETCAYTTHAEKNHLICSSQDAYEVSVVSIFQIRRLRLRKVSQSRDISTLSMPIAQYLAPSQQANTGWKDSWKNKKKEGKDRTLI